VEVKVPDIGDFKDVEVIELLVKPGDRIEREQSLVTVGGDKARWRSVLGCGRRQGDEGGAR
jgi:pyruvate/2-oxoglutarate dehydrogenase complex dihydrolipoamide acyltransferase (E2) component